MDKFDVIIVGAGGAGLMTARELGRLKYKVLLLDRKEDILNFTFNTLASFIDLEKFSLSEKVVSQKIKKVVFYTKRLQRKINHDLLVLDKRELHLELLNSLDKDYVELKTGISIQEFTEDENGNISTIKDKSGNEYAAKIFIDCSGNDGFFSKKLGLQEKNPKLATGVEYNVAYLGNKEELHLFMGREFQGGYGWVFPLKNNRAIVGFGSYNEVVVKDLKKRLEHILSLPTFTKLVKKDTSKCEGGSIPITGVKSKFVSKNMIAIGDSVSQVNPSVGEGYKFIFESSYIAVESINKCLQENNLSFLEEYEQKWNNRFLENYKFSKYLQEKVFKYSKFDFLIDLVTFFMKIKSDEKVIKVLSGEYNRKEKV